MIEAIKDISNFNPPQGYIEHLRTANLFIGMIGALILLFGLAWPKWKDWSVATRLGWMSLFLFVVVGTYSTFEIKFLNTYFRVPMVTVALLWAVMAAIWPLYDTWKQSRDHKLR